MYEIVLHFSVQVFLDFLVLCTFSFVVQFSRTAAANPACTFARRIFILPHFSVFVKGFFKLFSKTFFKVLARSPFWDRCRLGTRLLYHNLVRLSSAFFKFFSKFLAARLRSVSRPSALRYYSTFSTHCQGVFVIFLTLSSIVTFI